MVGLTIGSGNTIQTKQDINGNTTIINLLNKGSNIDLINMYSCNSETSNVAINFDNNYRVCVIDDDFQLTKYNNIIDKDDYLLNLNNDSINIKNNNIINNFNSNFIIKNNVNDIINIDNNINSIDFLNHNFNFLLTSNNFNLNTNDYNLFNCTSSNINITCDLYVNRILTEKIDSISGNGVEIQNLSIVQNNFNNVGLGNTLIDNTSDKSSNIPLVIDYNYNNSNIKQLLKLNKYYDIADSYETILQINKNGYINIGNTINTNENSILYINNKPNNYLNHNNNLNNYVLFEGDYDSDKFTINKYGSLTVGDDTNKATGLININRNDYRINLDLLNSNNINRDLPLLNLNIDYETKNNYVWDTSNYNYELNDVFNALNSDYLYTNNYSTLFSIGVFSGLSWKYLGNSLPSEYKGPLESFNDEFIKKLYQDNQVEGDIITLDVNDVDNNMQVYLDFRYKYSLRYDKLGVSYYYTPNNIYRKKIYYNYDNINYYFFHSLSINEKLDYDYKKLKLNSNNNKNIITDSSTTAEAKRVTYNNVLYDIKNLQYNTAQIEYEFKTIEWEHHDDISRNYLFYPDKINYDGETYILKIEALFNKPDDKSTNLVLYTDPPVSSAFTRDSIHRELSRFFDNNFVIGGSQESNFLDLIYKRYTNISPASTEEAKKFNKVKTDLFTNYSIIRHINIYASGIQWKKIEKPSDLIKITDIWDEFLLLDAFDRDSTNTAEKETKLKQEINKYKDTLPDNTELIKMENTNLLNLLKEASLDIDDNIQFGLSQNQWDNLNIDYIYCNHYLEDDTNYYYPYEKITAVFNLYYKKNSNLYRHVTSNYINSIINKPNFINLTSNNMNILNIDYNGTINYNNTNLNNSDYSLYAPDKIISTNKIEINEIVSKNNYIDFNNSLLSNISSIQFNDVEEFFIPKLNVNSILNDNNDIIFNNCKLSLDYDNTFTNTSNYLIYDETYNKNYDYYYNNILNFDLSQNNNVRPAITIYGDNPSYILKTDTNNSLLYQQTIANKKFNNLSSLGLDYVLIESFQINYYNENNDILDDNNFYTNNTQHLIEHIGGTYDILSIGQNYNICIDMKGVTSNSQTYTNNIANNSTNKSHSVSIGIPHNNSNINCEGTYLYNYPTYFDKIIKSNDYMLNIFGNTKIAGIDGETNAMSVVINDQKSSDNTYKVNVGIAIEPKINNYSNSLSVGGDLYADNIFYKNNQDYNNIINISNNVVTDLKNYLFKEKLTKSVIHTSNINNNFVNDNGIFNLNLIPKIPFTNFSNPNKPIREIIYYNLPQITSDDVNIDIASLDFKKGSTNIYTAIDDLEKITDEFNKYHYIVFKNNKTDYSQHLYKLTAKDSLTYDALIVGAGGGGGYVKHLLKWYLFEGDLSELFPGHEFTVDDDMEAKLLNNINSFTEDYFDDIAREFVKDEIVYNGYANISSNFSIDNNYIKIGNNYYKTYNNAGGNGGDVLLINSMILNKDQEITLKVGKKGVAGTNGTSSTSGTNSELININNDNYSANGGKNSQNFKNIPSDITLLLPKNIYDIFSIYDEYGINKYNKKYFGGDGNNIFLTDKSIGGGGGISTANAIENTGGGGGYYSNTWGDGANGIVIIRYKYNIKDDKITETIDNPSNGLLQYNWTNSNWQLNYDITDSCNTLIHKINETSNILNNKIDINSNSIIETTYQINTEILTSNNLLYSYIDNVSNILNSNDNNISNYINNIYNSTINIGAERIVSNVLDVDRIPLLPFSKFSNFEIDYIESPKINNEVIIDTEYYQSNIHINNDTDTDTEKKKYYEYIILKPKPGDDENDTKYNLYFQVPSIVDILIVGGGGSGKGGHNFCGGGGGGGVVIAKNVTIELNKNYEITVGKGGLNNTDGSSSSAFNLIAHGGKTGGGGGTGNLTGQGGAGGQTDTEDKSLINPNNIVYGAGGDGGSITFVNNLDGGESITVVDSFVSAIEGVESDIINNGSENNKTYRWGGGGGYSSKSQISFIPDGGSGGGGAGAFNSFNNSSSKTGLNYFNKEEQFISTTNSQNGIGLSGIDGKGGGGGASFGHQFGGKGGDGIVIIKIKSTSDIIDNKKKKGYISYNFNINKWEMNSLDLINLDIDFDAINQNITNSSNNLIDYVNTTLQTQEFGYIIVPSNFVTSSSIVNDAIYSYNIFGYMGKSYDLEENSGLQEDANGLITIPDTGYTDTNSPYYKHLLKGNKFSQGSITNDNIANNTITADKLQGTISGDKLALSSINYSDITGSIQGNVTILNDDLSGSLIDISSFNDISIDISLLDLTSSAHFSGLASITSHDNLIKIPVNKFSNINLDINNVNFSENYRGVTTIISDNSDINLDYFEKINLNISNLLNFGSSDFVLPEAYIDGIIDINYINNLYIYSSNINEFTLINTDVILVGEDKISPLLIKNLNLSARQIDDDGTQEKLINVTLNLNGEKINPNLLKDVQIRPSEIDFIPNSLNASIITLESDKINPELLSHITIIPSDLSNIDNYSIKLSNVTLDSSTDKLNPNIINSLTITPSDLSNIDNYSIKLNNVEIDTSTTLLNPNLIGNITLSPQQFNTIGAFQSVTLSSLEDESINPSLINENSIIVEARHLKLTDNDGNYYKLPTNLIYDIPDNSIAPSLIPDNIIIYGSNINLSSGDKLDSVTIQGEISSDILGNNITLSSEASIINNGKISGSVVINTDIDSKLINNAIINEGSNIHYTGTKIDSTIIYGHIDSSLVSNAYVYINSGNFTTITGQSVFSGTTTITGELDAKYINNAIIDLTETNTSLTAGSHITGDVTIIGVVDASHINPDTSVKINIENGHLNGSNIADESIPYTKLSSNLYLYVDEIKFSNGTSFISAIPDDIYTKQEIDTTFVSKQYYTSDISPFYNSDNLLNIKVNDNSILTQQILPIYNSNISTNNTFIYSQDDNMAFISVKSKQDNALIEFNSSNNTNLNNIGNKSIWNDGGFMKLNSERCSIILNSENVIEFANTSNFSHKPLYVPQIIFADGTNMNTYITPILNGDKQIIMNNTESGYTYSDSQITGEGFIHCNGLHAEFDITAFSSTTKSDINLKKDVKQLEYNNELLYLNPVTFKWKDINKSNSSNVGFIAQEIEEILPNLVKEGLDNYKSVNYVSLIPYLVKHIQNLEKRIVFLEENIKAT